MNNNQTLWTFGCSFTDDLERMTSIDEERGGSTFVDYKKWKGYTPTSWPTLLAQKMDMNLQNLGRGGSSNERILNTFLEFFSKIKKNDIVIIGWTQILRFPWANIHKYTLQDILPSGTYYMNYNEYFMSQRTQEEIHYNRNNEAWVNDLITKNEFITHICERFGIDVYFWTSCDFTSDYLKKTENLGNFITHQTEKDIFGYIYTQSGATIDDETDKEIMDPHLGEIGHKIKSQVFYEFIQSGNKFII